MFVHSYMQYMCIVCGSVCLSCLHVCKYVCLCSLTHVDLCVCVRVYVCKVCIVCVHEFVYIYVMYVCVCKVSVVCACNDHCFFFMHNCICFVYMWLRVRICVSHKL